MGNVRKNKWFIAIKERGADLFDLRGLRAIEPAEGTYHADPFLFRGLIFFELYDYEKGVIACMEKDGSNIRKVLEKPWHLSFPFIFEDEGETYMVPESAPNGTVDLYRCVAFPDKWEFVRNLLQGAYADTTIFKKGKEYLMFTTEGDNNLRIFRAWHIEGPWDLVFAESIPHSRGAGRIFELDGETIRPTQDGEKYGYKVHFKRIEWPYREKQAFMSIDPEWFPLLTGTHTFNFDETHVVIDGRIKL